MSDDQVPPDNHRSSEIDPERWRSIITVLRQAWELPTDKRSAFVKRKCANDSDLRGYVDSLLSADRRSHELLDLPEGRKRAESLPSTVRVDPSEERSKGDRINHYRLLQTIGEGGMGVVYEAEQTEPVRRRVALKVIKHGMDTKQVIARFEAERQALALMNHPNVAKVLDAGTTEQHRPYFAMELVKGVPITELCDRQRLNTRERLELFMQVCEGVQHAHQKGIIHRDIKPSNVLVQTESDERVPKIIDFGVARATAQRLTERTLFTELGQMIGTPEYMSPEQAEMTGEDIDTRTDVYSLGVLLYELLAGALPFDSHELRRAGFDEIRKRIREEEPSKPSTRLSALGDESVTSAKRRRTDPSSLRRQLSGDLDWITMKSLEKDRVRRYGSPREFADDIERHLAHRPVVACPPSAAYRLVKFTRRHRFGVAVAAAGLVGMGMFIAAMAWQATRLDTTRHLIQAEAESSEQLLSAAQRPVLEGTVKYRFDLDRLAPLGPGERNAALWFADFNAHDGSRREEFEKAHRRAYADRTQGLPAVLSPRPSSSFALALDEPLLLEAEEWADQSVMRFYPDVWAPSGIETALPNLLMVLDLSKAWVARGDAHESVAGALEDYRRTIRLGRLMRQEGFDSLTHLVGLHCIRMGLEAMFLRHKAEGDQLRADQAALALAQATNDRWTHTHLIHLLDVDPYVRSGWFSLSMDLPDWKLEQIATNALENPERLMRRAAAFSLCKIHWHGTPQQRSRAREILDQLARNDAPLLTADTACAVDPFATGLIAVPD